MREVRTEIEIAASASSVWQVLTDFARYSEWNPFISCISGELVDGCLSSADSLPSRQIRTQTSLRYL